MLCAESLEGVCGCHAAGRAQQQYAPVCGNRPTVGGRSGALEGGGSQPYAAWIWQQGAPQGAACARVGAARWAWVAAGSLRGSGQWRGWADGQTTGSSFSVLPVLCLWRLQQDAMLQRARALALGRGRDGKLVGRGGIQARRNLSSNASLLALGTRKGAITSPKQAPVIRICYMARRSCILAFRKALKGARLLISMFP